MKRSLTRLALLLSLALALALSLAGAASAADRWTDITDQQWVTTYQITAAEAATVADGYPDGTFKPYLAVNRGQFSKMAVNGLGLAPNDPTSPTFSDVARGSTFYVYIEGAAAAGVVSGYPDGLFRPTNEISRQQAATMLGRVVSNAELEAQGSIMGTAANYATLAAWYQAEGDFYLGAYTDWQQIEVVHRPTMAYLIFREVVSGSGFQLNPTGSLTRAQAVAMVLRALAAVDDVTHVTPPAAPTDMTVTPTGPSSDTRPFISGHTLVPGGDVVVYDTFGGATTEIAQGVADAAGEFTVRVPLAAALQEGLHSFTAKVKDSRGRVSDASQAVAYRVDLTAPQATITSPADAAALFSPKPAFTVDATDTGSGVAEVVFQYALDVTVPSFQTISTDTVSPYQAEWTGVGLPADNRYKLRAVVTDKAGNQTLAGPITIILDRLAPTAQIVSIDNSVKQGNVWFTADLTPNFSADAFDPAPASGGPASGIAQVSFYYAPSANVPADPTTTAGFTLISTTGAIPGYRSNFAANLPVGVYRFAVQSVDRAGNLSLIHTQEIVVGAPTITSLNPAAGPIAGGGSMTIKGANLLGATAVNFGAATPVFAVLDATTVTCTIPSSATAGGTTPNVTVTSPAGSSNGLTYTYVAVPTLTSLDPIAGPIAGGGSMTIKGANLLGATAVNFGAATPVFAVLDATTVTCTIPSSATAGGTTPSVTVTTAGGTSSGLTYTYVLAPTISLLDPNTGPLGGGTLVTITGTNLLATTTVNFGTATLTFMVVDATTVTCFSPFPGGTVDVTVPVTVGSPGGVSNALNFRFSAP